MSNIFCLNLHWKEAPRKGWVKNEKKISKISIQLPPPPLWFVRQLTHFINARRLACSDQSVKLGDAVRLVICAYPSLVTVLIRYWSLWLCLSHTWDLTKPFKFNPVLHIWGVSQCWNHVNNSLIGENYISKINSSLKILWLGDQDISTKKLKRQKPCLCKS